ncbi:MAG: hypothetical protein ACJ8DI_08175 [Ktedonobacteraceae bacterium]
MRLVPLTECCLWLGVDPKTLRLWLQAAQLAWCLHPEDARKKCLTLAQLQQLAELHGRPLPAAVLQTVVSPACAPASEQGGVAPSSQPNEAEVRQQLHLLQQQVSTLQAQVTELALLLVRANLAQGDPPATSAAALPVALAVAAAPAGPAATDAAPARITGEIPGAVPAQPVRTRSRALPLIQVRADSSVVAIAPNEGVLSVLPDSAAWFAWLSSLTAFSFESQQGRFSATRKFRQGSRVQSWNVHGSLHGRSCTLYLGLTPTLTLARLQGMALAVHTRLTAL